MFDLFSKCPLPFDINLSLYLTNLDSILPEFDLLLLPLLANSLLHLPLLDLPDHDLSVLDLSLVLLLSLLLLPHDLNDLPVLFPLQLLLSLPLRLLFLQLLLQLGLHLQLLRLQLGSLAPDLLLVQLPLVGKDLAPVVVVHHEEVVLLLVSWRSAQSRRGQCLIVLQLTLPLIL